MKAVPSEEKTIRKPLTEGAARLIVRMRYFIFILFAAALVFSALCVGRVRVNNDLTLFLPEESETRQALSAMSGEFVTYESIRVMVTDISPSDAEALAGELRSSPHVAQVSFDDTDAHYKDGRALFSITFDLPSGDPAVDGAVEGVESRLSSRSYEISRELHNYSEQLAGEMIWVILLSAAVITAVLLFTSRSYFEVVIFFIVFGTAGLLNMGTNFLLGEITAITHSVAVILQLALAIDYAIIFAHNFQSERARIDDDKEALTIALAHSMREISSSSLTTVAGLAALTLMQFRLGRDLGFVLAKGILCSMLTVFLLMPGLMLLFSKLLSKTAHRTLVPRIDRFGKFVVRRKIAFLLLFALILPFAVIGSSNVDYAFNNSSVSQIIRSDSRTATENINAVFSPDTAIAMVLPKGSEEKQKEVLKRAAALEGVKSAVGLAGVEIFEGVALYDRVNYKDVAALLGQKESDIKMLFSLYALSVNADGGVYSDMENYRVRVIDLLFYVADSADFLPIEEEQLTLLTSRRAELERAVAQLSGEHKERLVFTCGYAPESEEGALLVEKLREVAEDETLYGKGVVLLAGDVTSARDLKASYKSDSVLISVLSIVFVFLILLFTFRSVIAAAILVFVIQGSIWINFSFAYIFSMRPSFVTQMIVSAIQMGATIDYAIVFMSRYLARRKTLPAADAVVAALNDCFPTVLTSGSIMTVAGLLIAFRVSDVYVGHIGLAVGRGAAISVLLVLTALPQLTLLCDKAIEKTTFGLRFHKKEKRKENA